MYDKDRPNVPPPPTTEMYPPRESAARKRSRQRVVSGGEATSGWALVIAATTLVMLALFVSVAVVLYLTVYEQEQEVLPTAVLDLPTPVSVRQDFSDVDISLISGSSLMLDDGREIIIEPWDGESRFTILMMGLDRRPGESGLAYRTDTMMVVSMDPATDSIGILSIPRDLYVPVPGYNEYQRINSAMVLGELQRAGNGPTLAMQTVQSNLGIRINDYVAVDFQAFINFVDTIGGIEITTNYTINDPAYPNMYYGFDPFYLPAGTHQLDGATALKYARTRHGSSDFQRALRQQEVLYAIRDKVLQPGVLAQLIIQSPTLYEQFEEDISTGLMLDQMIQLTLYLKDIPTENISTGVIDQRYISNYTTQSGSQVLIPNRYALGPLLTEVFGETYNE
jgi:polyisoprenyl-teichoic acid--peptidoglycan teichoic acid transferase